MNMVQQGEAIRLVHLVGPAHERGREHGRRVGAQLRSYWKELVLDVTTRSDRPMSEPDLKQWVAARAEPAVALAPDLDEEIRGIAEGGGVDYEVALAVNLGEEVNHLAYALGQSTSGGYLLAQTWDGPDWTPDPMLYLVEEEVGRSVFLADPGWVGGVGLNDRGLATVHTGVETIADGTPGMPYSFMARRILQSSSRAVAIRSVVETPATAGCHYTIADGTHVTDVEVAGEAHATLPWTAPLSTCAHFSDPTCAALESDLHQNRISRYRVERLLHLLTARSPVAPLDLFTLISDHEEGPLGATVCRHPGIGRSLGGIVIDHANATLWAKAGNPCLHRPVTEVHLTSLSFETHTFGLEGKSDHGASQAAGTGSSWARQ